MISYWLRRIIFRDYRIIHNKGYYISNCPACGSFASLERLFDKSIQARINRIIGFKKYHCRNCKWDGYLHTKRITENPRIVLRNYIFALFWFIVFGFILAIILSHYYDTL
jgi:hypothetical protein